MPAISGRFDWRTGLTWNIGFVAGGTPVTQIKNGTLHVCPALVDTGASTTCISSEVAKALSLAPAGKTGLQTAGGAVDVNVYDVHVAFFLGGKTDEAGNKVGQLEFFSDIQAPEFDPGGNHYKAIIGRDILKRGVLILSFDGHYSFSY
ncbi:MAG: aspartyl protease family protein [Rhodospirillaceae bacterium]|nr:aspartyl protease family protein [Rhodospirillaceae bacterium]